MSARKPSQLRREPSPTVMEAIRKRLAGRNLEEVETLFAFRTTAQQVDNAITEWLSGTAVSPARFQILVLLWAAGGRGVAHKEIVAALSVARATVSGLMAALEREGLLKSSASHDDRRTLLAILTSRGQTVVEKAIDANTVRLRAAFASLSSDELTILTGLLQRLRQGFAAGTNAR